jgi:hypothetical protein
MSKKRADPAPQRVNAAVDLLCGGLRYRQVVAELEQRFGISDRQAERDIARAYEALAEDEKESRPQRKGKLRAFLWRQARLASTASDFRASVAAAVALSRLDGLDAPQKLEHSGEVVTVADALTPVQREKRIAELERLRREASA